MFITVFRRYNGFCHFTQNWCEKDLLVETWWKFTVLGVNFVLILYLVQIWCENGLFGVKNGLFGVKIDF
jgi:hypothetical protein